MRVYIVAYSEGGYMVPVVDTVYKSKHGAKKAKDKYLKSITKNHEFIKILCANNWHEV